MKKIFIGFLLFAFFFINVGYAKETVKVGGYLFPPFVEMNNDGYTGITLDIIKAMNAFQNKYQFKFYPTAPKRRYQSFQNKEFNMIMFESKDWGWKNLSIESSKVFSRGGEVYIALSKPGRGQNFFSDFENKKMIGILGYHYGFAAFNNDENFLKKKFKIKLVTTHDNIIRLILMDRYDIAVVTKSNLHKHLLNDPKIKKKLIISKKFDQIYNHTILVRKGSAPNVDEINKMLTELKKAGVLQNLWRKYGIVDSQE